MAQRQNYTQASNITGLILQNLPPEAGITRIEYEGPRIALYTKSPRFLQENSYLISDIVNTVKRRVVIRTDKAIRKPEEEALSILKGAIPREAEASNFFFDDALGEVIIEATRPRILAPEKGFNIPELTEKVGWRIVVKRSPQIQCPSLQGIYYALRTGAKDRERFLREVGEKIFRPKLVSDPEITITPLGAFKEVGRSAVLITTSESRILLDCGINPGARNPRDAYPRFDWINLDLDGLDAVVLSHAHLDHIGFLPVLFKYGYDGPVYCSEPTEALMNLLLTDAVKVSTMEGGRILYDLKDVRETIRHCIPLPYGLVTDVSPDVKIVLQNAGHILGSATIHLHIGEGAHNIVYTGDYKFGRTMLLDSTFWNYPRVETLITESTYGSKEDIMPSREEVEAAFVASVNETLTGGGKVLIPVPAVGRAQEIMLVLDQYMREGRLIEAPIFIEGMISEATAIHIAYPDYLIKSLSEKILDGDSNPFLSEYFTTIEHPDSRSEALIGGPCIIMATSGMLEGGPVLEYLEDLAPSDKNKILFVSYQISGTLGRRVQDGVAQISLPSEGGKIRIIDVKAKVEKIEGFSGHSDYNQIVKFVARLRPKLQQVIINHGERRKVEGLSYSISRIFKIQTFQPVVTETIKLR